MQNKLGGITTLGQNVTENKSNCRNYYSTGKLNKYKFTFASWRWGSPSTINTSGSVTACA
jgi:hypothetical protein